MDVLLLAFTAALNPTLLAATTVMLLLPKPRSLMLGYLLGALMTGVTAGLVIVFYLQDSGAVSVAKNSLSPIEDLVLGVIALIIARALSAERDAHLRERRARHKTAKGKNKSGPPRWQRAISKGTARTTFVIGALLSLPGTSYLVALVRLAKEDLATAETVLVILAFNLIALALLEVPLVAYWLEPETTPEKVERFKAWLRRDGRRVAIRVATVIGVLLIGRGAITLVT